MKRNGFLHRPTIHLGCDLGPLAPKMAEVKSGECQLLRYYSCVFRQIRWIILNLPPKAGAKKKDSCIISATEHSHIQSHRLAWYPRWPNMVKPWRSKCDGLTVTVVGFAFSKLRIPFSHHQASQAAGASRNRNNAIPNRYHPSIHFGSIDIFYSYYSISSLVLERINRLPQTSNICTTT